MKNEVLLTALYFVKHDLEVTRITKHHIVIRQSHADVFYRADKMVENYNSIIDGNEPKYYKNLYL